MLRTLLLIVALAVGVIGLGAHLAGHRDAMPAALWGFAIAVAVLVERWRYRSRNAGVDGDWQKTEERFVDPESGQTLQVLYNPRTGERRYEPDNHA
ncbi:hypothetical protein ACS5PN_12935 [Roseateles sp. NT4]|uniref:hypothetical protein n=1 Tax=Roseateles sp. NT4 TaxID=3453715 RepID=UPI003EED7A4E